MAKKSILVFILIASALVGCSITFRSVGPTVTLPRIPTLEFSQPSPFPIASPTLNQTPSIVPPLTQPPSTQQIVLDRAFAIISALKNKDMSRLEKFVHPQLGLRFSPYAAVKDTDQVFPIDKIAGLMADNTIYTWGAYDGSGKPIDLTFANYYSRFVYDVDFANSPQLALNHRLGVSTIIDNSTDFYAGPMIVEYYFPGFDPQMEGMDWRSLRLVFMEDNNTWYLVGIIHDQWTT